MKRKTITPTSQPRFKTPVKRAPKNNPPATARHAEPVTGEARQAYWPSMAAHSFRCFSLPPRSSLSSSGPDLFFPSQHENVNTVSDGIGSRQHSHGLQMDHNTGYNGSSNSSGPVTTSPTPTSTLYSQPTGPTELRDMERSLKKRIREVDIQLDVLERGHAILRLERDAAYMAKARATKAKWRSVAQEVAQDLLNAAKERLGGSTEPLTMTGMLELMNVDLEVVGWQEDGDGDGTWLEG